MKILEGEQKPDTNILSDILGCISEGDTVVDAGAWIGGYTVPMCELVGNEGMVYAFEPNKEAWECLYANISKFVKVLCYNVALGDKEQGVGLHSEKGKQDSGYVVNGSEVRMMPLDDYKLSPDFIKIDVEGCELKVLKGATRTIKKYRPKMIIEINREALDRQGNTSHEIFDWLRKRHYVWSIIDDPFEDVFNIIATPK